MTVGFGIETSNCNWENAGKRWMIQWVTCEFNLISKLINSFIYPSTGKGYQAIRMQELAVQRNDLFWWRLKCLSQVLPASPQQNLLKFNYKVSKSTKMSITLKPHHGPTRRDELTCSVLLFFSAINWSLYFDQGQLDWYTFTSHEVQLLKLSAANRGNWTCTEIGYWWSLSRGLQWFHVLNVELGTCLLLHDLHPRNQIYWYNLYR